MLKRLDRLSRYAHVGRFVGKAAVILDVAYTYPVNVRFTMAGFIVASDELRQGSLTKSFNSGSCPHKVD